MIDEKKLIEDIDEEIKCMNLEKDKYFKNGNFHNGNIIVEQVSAIKIIKKIIENQPKFCEWIPSNDKLPQKPFSCLVTIIDSCFNGSYFEDFENILPYFVGYSDGQWNDSDGEKIPFEVTAWMPAPKEPYHED